MSAPAFATPPWRLEQAPVEPDHPMNVHEIVLADNTGSVAEIECDPAVGRFIVRAANAHEALLDALDGCDEWHSLCVECGPNVGVDEDGCCATCGATAMGAYLDAFRVTARAALKLAEET